MIENRKTKIVKEDAKKILEPQYQEEDKDDMKSQ